ncbi:MAG TPA: hypothetical protein DEP48_03065 [Persephonella sp.]|uniref:Uncharacterized protein n=1 Tax=Persephonella marina (strain DSM 14350 / EX-H1) TaxID=123214 RepID=C0QSC7_PERMH|nr:MULTISPECIES: hypothetical protein [Persephonella]ACO03495.1 hypothetical protein PERMA_1810 [Persephonella marina EX-H1]HCB69319.1 hypothetical protein [Persephonella sp.]
MENRVVKLIDEDGNKVVLPIDNTGLEINKSIKYQDDTGEGNSSLTRLYEGYEPAYIDITFSLADEEDITAFEKLKRIEKAFKRLKDGRPVIWTIIDKHCKARGVKKVQFYDLRSSETDTGIEATLQLIEAQLPEEKKEKKTSTGTNDIADNTSENTANKTKTCTAQSTSEYCRKLLVKYEKERMEGKTILAFEDWAKQKPLPPSADTDTIAV